MQALIFNGCFYDTCRKVACSSDDSSSARLRCFGGEVERGTEQGMFCYLYAGF